METISTTSRKANKKHICDFCLGTIEKGEVYSHQVNKMEGDIYTWKSHKVCIDFIFSRTDLCLVEGATHGLFVECICETYRELEPDTDYLDIEFQIQYDKVIEAFKQGKLC